MVRNAHTSDYLLNNFFIFLIQYSGDLIFHVLISLVSTAPCDTRDRSIVGEYKGLVGAGHLNYDKHQVRVVEQLEILRQQLHHYEPLPPQPDGLISRVII